MTTNTNTPVTQTYYDVQNMLYDIAHKFLRKYGGDFEELVSQANLYFMTAYNSFSSKKSNFTTWCYFIVWKGLLNERQKEIKTNYIPCDTNGYDEDGCFIDFIDELSEDSKIIVGLILDTPNDLKILIERKGGTLPKVKTVIREHLNELGWSMKRITESFSEIRGLVDA